MNNTIDLPLPPLCVARPDNTVSAGATVVINLLDGKKLVGKLAFFDSTEGILGVLTKGQDTPASIPLNKLNIMHLPEPRSWTDKSAPAHEGLTLPPEPQEFLIEFKDGQKLDGETIGFRADKHGVHFFPKHTTNKFMHSFTPYGAIKNYRVGQQIGQMLVEDRLVSEQDLKSSLADQSQRRNQPLGEYLVTKAIMTTQELAKALTRQKSMPQMKLGEILVSENLVSEAQLQEALVEQKENRNIPLGELLVNKGLVTTEDIQQSLAKKLGIPFVDLRKFQIVPEVLSLVPRDIAVKHSVLPIFRYEDKLAVAIENPLKWDALDAMRFHTGVYIEPVMATAADIQWALDFYYSPAEVAQESIDELTGEDDNDDFGMDALASDSEDEITDNVVVKLLDKIIVDAKNMGVSDIHIEPNPGKAKIMIRFRKDGTLMKYHELPGQYKGALVSRIKIMAQLDISEKRRPQDGKIEFKKQGVGKLELRVATVPTSAGQEDVVMRLLAGGKPIPMDQLALSPRNLEDIQRIITRPYGLFLVCGPTGSGKTTTLHSILGHINTPERKIWTAEDPVEITQTGLRQVQMNAKIGLNFAAAMRSFLRADPDVIMVGEMRDQETVQIGIEASLTGHLVFSTLHTNSAPESIIRLLDMGMDPFNFADALLGVVAQRLTKRLCKSCKEAYTPTADEMGVLAMEYCSEMVRGMEPDQVKEIYAKQLSEWAELYAKDGQFTLYKKKGCDICDKTGYKGRIGIHELLVGTDPVKKNILEHAPVSTLLATCLAEGMRTLRQDGLSKVVQGHTDMAQIRAVCSK